MATKVNGKVFKCQKLCGNPGVPCGCETVQEVAVGVMVTSAVDEIDGEDVYYGENNGEDGEVVRYQCASCWGRIAKTQDELIEAAKHWADAPKP